MNENKHTWVRRPQEWIKENPGKPYMYKLSQDSTEIPSIEQSYKSSYFKTIKEDIKYNFSSAGVYSIICKKTNRVYVGMSKSLESRIEGHRKNIFVKSRTPSEKHYILMREDFKKYGENSFEFNIYKKSESRDEKTLRSMEIEAMLYFHKEGYDFYNIDLPVYSKVYITGAKAHSSALLWVG